MHRKREDLLKSLAFALIAGCALCSASMLQPQGPGVSKSATSSSGAEQYVNLSALHFGRSTKAAPILEESIPGTVELPERSSLPTASVRSNGSSTIWNSKPGISAEGRLVFGAHNATLQSLALDSGNDDTVTAKSLLWEGRFVCTAPHIVIPDSGCCSYTYKDQVANADVFYRQPYHVFKDKDPNVSEANSRKFAKTVRASMPFFLPYKDCNIGPGQGWLYEKGSFHGAIDYGKDKYPSGQDPTFKVCSVADGTVVTVLWDNWSGNVVIIEHTASNGDRYRSAYMHLRNGFEHDLAKARAIVVTKDQEYNKDGKPTNLLKYKEYAAKGNPSHLQWGTNDQKIAVNPGDRVYAGQFIAYSGNTGPGGAGSGLNDSGDPFDPTRANNHLHLMTAVPSPTPGSKEWVQIDPYGVYNMRATGCYEMLEDTPFVRLFAPFYPSFHNVPAAVVAKYFGYYTGMGMALQTLSLHKGDDAVLASGSFQPGLSLDWYARFYMTSADLQVFFDDYHKKGYRPREIGVVMDSHNNPRFNVIWKKRGNETYQTFPALSDYEWNVKWFELVKIGKMRVEDHFAYSLYGVPHHAAIFVGDGDTAFQEWHYMSPGAFQAKFDQNDKAGFRLVSVNAAEVGDTLLGGVWRKVAGAWIAHTGLTPEKYQQRFLEYHSQGFRVYKIQGYADSERFAAIWTKP